MKRCPRCGNMNANHFSSEKTLNGMTECLECGFTSRHSSFMKPEFDEVQITNTATPKDEAEKVSLDYKKEYDNLMVRFKVLSKRHEAALSVIRDLLALTEVAEKDE